MRTGILEWRDIGTRKKSPENHRCTHYEQKPAGDLCARSALPFRARLPRVIVP